MADAQPATEPARPRVFSGIRATGDKTLGNYSGGYRQYAATQEQGEAFFCIVDLHSITTPIEPAELREFTLAGAAMLFATGLDPDRSTVFAQSHVVAHAEAAWLLSAATSFGELRRMTQFKEKSERQHLELTRDVAERFNQRYGETFAIPRAVYPEEGARIKNLQEPERLMSTTRGAPQGVVRMVDEPDVIRKKFKTAVTDSEKDIRHQPDAKPGISNLLEIMSVATGEPVAELERRYDGAGYGQFKEEVGEAVVALLAPIQERYRELRADERELQRLLAVGAEKARRASEPTLEAMYDRMGFVKAEAGRFFGAARPRGL